MPAQPRAGATGAPLQRRETELPLAAFGRNLQMTKRWQQLVSYHSKKLVACATVAQGDHCQIRRRLQFTQLGYAVTNFFTTTGGQIPYRGTFSYQADQNAGQYAELQRQRKQNIGL